LPANPPLALFDVGRLRDAHDARVFSSVISVEMEQWAHQTLDLRALYRRLHDNGDTKEYYRYLRGESFSAARP